MSMIVPFRTLRSRPVLSFAQGRAAYVGVAAVTRGSVPQQRRNRNTYTSSSSSSLNALTPLNLYSFSSLTVHSQINSQINSHSSPWIRIPTGSCRLVRRLSFVVELNWQGHLAHSASAAAGFLPVALLLQLREVVTLREKRKESRRAIVKDIQRHELFLRPHRLAVQQKFQAAGLSKALRKHHQIRIKVDKDDKEALMDYTGPGYAIINQFLRCGGKLSVGSMESVLTNQPEQVRRRVTAVQRAMTKRLPVHQGNVYRGISFQQDHLEDYKNIKDQLRVGATFQDAAFISTSQKEDKAFQPRGPLGVFFVIRSKTGVNVSKYSKHEKEEEILFYPGTLFRIKEVGELPSGVVRVVMEELV